MRFSKMVLFTVPLLLTACTMNSSDLNGSPEDVGAAAQAVVARPAIVELSVTEGNTAYLVERAGACTGDGVVIRDGRLIRQGVDSGYSDVSGITVFNDPSRNAGERVCHNKEFWLRLAAYACQANDQYVDPGNGTTGNYVGQAVEDWQLAGFPIPILTDHDPLPEFFPTPAPPLRYSFVNHADKDVTTGLNFAYLMLEAEPCPTPSNADFLLERIECCMGAPNLVSPP